MHAATQATPRARGPDGSGAATGVAERGFTLVELLIVIAIIGILASIAIVAYQRYTKRTQMMEVVLAASACRTPVSEAFHLGDTVPDPGGWGCEQADGTRFVASVSVDGNGKVTVVPRNFDDSDIDAQQLTLTPLIDGAVATGADIGKPVTAWRCGSSADGTTVPERYLPSSCR